MIEDDDDEDDEVFNDDLSRVELFYVIYATYHKQKRASLPTIRRSEVNATYQTTILVPAFLLHDTRRMKPYQV